MAAHPSVRVPARASAFLPRVRDAAFPRDVSHGDVLVKTHARARDRKRSIRKGLLSEGSRGLSVVVRCPFGARALCGRDRFFFS